MTIPKLTPYTGQVANPDGSQTQTEFTQNMFGQLSYEAQLATELDATIDGMNQAVTDVENSAAAASASATAAEASASTAGYQGLWPDTGGSASKGDTYQTQVGGVSTGNYFTALQNTTVDPVGDNVNWKVAGTIGQQNISDYTDFVYKASGANSAVENMIAGIPTSLREGEKCSTGLTKWVRNSNSNGDLSDFDHTGPIYLIDFGVKDGVAESIKHYLDQINDIVPSNGGAEIILPPTDDYIYLDGKVEIEKNIIIKGSGYTYTGAISATRVLVASGTTAFHIKRGADGQGGGQLLDFNISAASFDAESTTASTTAASREIQLSGAFSAEVGQFVLIKGVGNKRPYQNGRSTASYTSGSNLITLNQEVSPPVGTRIDITGAGLSGETYITNRVSSTQFEISENATATGSDDFYYYEDLPVMVTEVSGSTVSINKPTVTSASSAIVEHYDCAIVSQTQLTDVSVSVTNFKNGASLLIQGGGDVDNGDGVYQNANAGKVSKLISQANRNAIHIIGADANAWEMNGIYGLGDLEWSVVESSFLGNSYYSPHFDGGFGMQSNFVNSTNCLFGPYTESGTYHTFSLRDSSYGGFGNLSYAGIRQYHGNGLNNSEFYVSGRLNELQYIGSATSSESNSGFRTLVTDQRGNSLSITERGSNPATDGNDNLIGLFDTIVNRPLVMQSTRNHPRGVGYNYAPKGILIGHDGRAAETYYRAHTAVASSLPTSGNYTRGDVIWNHSLAAGGHAGWVCTTSGVAGSTAVFKLFGNIEA